MFALTLGLVTLVAPLVVHLFMPAIPAVKAAFAVSDAMAQLVFTAGGVTLACTTLVYGSLSDRLGRRPVLLAGLGLFLIGSLIAALATSFHALMVGRLIQAAGAGCGITLVRTIARDAYGQQNLVKAIAYLTMFYTLGPMFAPLAGGLLIDQFGWRGVFVLGGVAGTVIIACAVLFTQETLVDAPAPENLRDIVRSHVAPFGQLLFAACLFQTGFSTGVFYTLTTASAVIMQDQLGLSAAQYGLYFLLLPIGFTIGNYVTSRLTGRFSGPSLILAGSLFQAGAVAAQGGLLLAGWVSPLTLILPGLIVTFAQGIALPCTQATAIAMMPKRAGTASGLGVFIQFLVASLVSQVYGFVADGTVVPLVLTLSVASALTLAMGLIARVLQPG